MSRHKVGEKTSKQASMGKQSPSKERRAWGGAQIDKASITPQEPKKRKRIHYLSKNRNPPPCLTIGITKLKELIS